MATVEDVRIIELPKFLDARGNLSFAEQNNHIPFEIKRAFYMHGTDAKMVRGSHANKKTEFVLINVAGTSKVRVDDGFSSAIIELNKPRMALYLPAMLWKDMYFLT